MPLTICPSSAQMWSPADLTCPTMAASSVSGRYAGETMIRSREMAISSDHDVEAVVNRECLQAEDDVTMLEQSEQMKGLLHLIFGKFPHMDERDRCGFPHAHFNGGAQIEVVDLLAVLPWRFPLRPEPVRVGRSEVVRWRFCPVPVRLGSGECVR